MGLRRLARLFLSGQAVFRSARLALEISAFRVSVHSSWLPYNSVEDFLVPMDMTVQLKALLLASVFLIVSGSG